MILTSKSIHDDPRNYERGLTFVSLLIHLPPQSDDIAGGNRDARDVTDENISKAQIIYGIISSTFDEKLKSRKSVQPHFAFEIVGTGGLVSFYAVVPVEILETVKQAVISAYPSARLEHVRDFNIFNEFGKVSGMAGGEMDLKENYAFPIATYQDIKRDTMQALLSSLASLQKDDSVAIQILIRPAKETWRKNANDIADKKRKGKYDKKNKYEMVGGTLKQMAVALVKAPEDKKDEPKEELSGIERSLIDAIEEKTRHPGFETLIRIIANSNMQQRSDAILGNVIASFSLYDAPGKNGFRFTRSKDLQELAAAYILRAFPREKNEVILNAVELATLFHFPDQSSIPTSQLARQESKQVDGPRNMPEQGLLLGYNEFRGAKKPIRISLADRQRHIYVVGQTGTGKSTFLEDLAYQDMHSGNGFAFVDPHGDTAERLLSMVPASRTEDVIYFSPAEMDYPMGLNLFEFHSADQKDFLIQEALNMLYKLYDPQHSGIMGPRYEHLFRNAALTVMADPAGGTFVDIPKLFRDPAFVKQKLQYVKDHTVLEFWQKEMPQSQRSNEFGDVVSWFVSKFGAFLSNEMMRNIIGQTKSALDLRDIMDNKKILIVNLSKGRTGELNSKLLGMVFVMKFNAAAMSRANIPEDKRVDFSLYVDEFQNFSTDSFATIMSEARKYRLNLIVANQFTTQLTEEIRDAVFGNMGTIVSFRVGQNDVDTLSKYFQPQFGPEDLLRVPNYNTIVRTLVNGVPTQPFSMTTLPPLGHTNPHLAQALKQLSAAKFGRPKGQVEAEIFERMKTIQPVMPPASLLASGPSTVAGQPGSGMPSAGTKPPSVLDEWLSKRKTMPSQPTSSRHQTLTQPQLQPEPHIKITADTLPTEQKISEQKKDTSSHSQSAVATPHPIIEHKPIAPVKPASAMAEAHHDTAKPAEKKQAPATDLATKPKAKLSQPHEEKTKEAPKKETPPQSGTIHFQPHNNNVAEDTIAIDAEGNLIYRNTDSKQE